MEESYDLEYGRDSLSLQKSAINPFQKFVIVEHLLATGGKAKCVSKMLIKSNKEILALLGCSRIIIY